MRIDGDVTYYFIQHNDGGSEWDRSNLGHILFQGLSFADRHGALGSSYRMLLKPESANSELWQTYGIHGFEELHGCRSRPARAGQTGNNRRPHVSNHRAARYTNDESDGMNTLAALLGHSVTKSVVAPKLSRSVVTHDSIDDMELENHREDSPRFRKMTVDEPPLVMPAIEDPPAPDFTTASHDEIAAYQVKAREVKKAREDAPEYKAWGDLTGDVFRSYHTHDQPSVVEPVDPGVELHARILPKLMTQDEHAQSRNITRDDATLSALATMATTKALREILAEELADQAREAQEYEERREEAQQSQGSLEEMREQAKELHERGKPIPAPLVEAIKQAVQERQTAVAAAQQIAAEPTPMNTQAVVAIERAAQAGSAAAEAAKGMPSFGSGVGAGEPVYTSPEQALSIAERWANDPKLRAMAQLFGRMDRDIRFKRSKRIAGGNDEIVDIQFGDNLGRTLPSELALLADPEFEDDFYARYAGEELLQFSTVGEENAGRGPIVLVLDGSGTMANERNVWARAVAMCLLHIARLEKRDFACIEFSGSGQLAEWVFRAQAPMDAEMVVDMASHLFSGGTVPIQGVARAAQMMKEAPAFRKADVVLIGDGEAPFGDEDKRLRDQLNELGVRIFGIGIGGSLAYIQKYCEPDGYVVNVRDFDLTDPSTATAELATHIT